MDLTTAATALEYLKAFGPIASAAITVGVGGWLTRRMNKIERVTVKMQASDEQRGRELKDLLDSALLAKYASNALSRTADHSPEELMSVVVGSFTQISGFIQKLDVAQLSSVLTQDDYASFKKFRNNIINLIIELRFRKDENTKYKARLAECNTEIEASFSSLKDYCRSRKQQATKTA